MEREDIKTIDDFIDYYTKPLMDNEMFGLYDTKRESFIVINSGKFSWRKESHAKVALSNLISSSYYWNGVKTKDGKPYRYADQDRIIIKKLTGK